MVSRRLKTRRMIQWGGGGAGGQADAPGPGQGVEIKVMVGFDMEGRFPAFPGELGQALGIAADAAPHHHDGVHGLGQLAHLGLALGRGIADGVKDLVMGLCGRRPRL